MNYNLNEAIEVLERTPRTLDLFLSGLSEGWLKSNEGDGTWNPKEVIGHLIESEKTNFIERIEVILSEEGNKSFPPFDRFSHLNNPETSLEALLQEFKDLRSINIIKLKSLIKPDSNLESTGIHRSFGEVKLRELLSTWVVHDLTHIAQIVRVMAKRYSKDVAVD